MNDTHFLLGPKKKIKQTDEDKVKQRKKNANI